ncbi:hypothetical protein HZS_2380 [Henneguya salminicola]|nr:hypothetical protein HZS_2380 [Henneguya salminicola]
MSAISNINRMFFLKINARAHAVQQSYEYLVKIIRFPRPHICSPHSLSASLKSPELNLDHFSDPHSMEKPSDIDWVGDKQKTLIIFSWNYKKILAVSHTIYR